jgi:hypothetical protein
MNWRYSMIAESQMIRISEMTYDWSEVILYGLGIVCGTIFLVAAINAMKGNPSDEKATESKSDTIVRSPRVYNVGTDFGRATRRGEEMEPGKPAEVTGKDKNASESLDHEAR